MLRIPKVGSEWKWFAGGLALTLAVFALLGEFAMRILILVAWIALAWLYRKDAGGKLQQWWREQKETHDEYMQVMFGRKDDQPGNHEKDI